MERQVPAISTKEDLERYLRPYYIIDDYMESYDSFSEFQESIYTIIKGCYEYKALRTHPVKFKFYERDMEFHT